MSGRLWHRQPAIARTNAADAARLAGHFMTGVVCGRMDSPWPIIPGLVLTAALTGLVNALTDGDAEAAA